LERLKSHVNINVVENKPYKIARKCYNNFSIKEKDLYNLSANLAINFLNDIEPRLANSINTTDIDVRDVLAIRSLQKWESGFSAKNNHRAVKHSRLSESLNFGNTWLGIPCSENYFSEIKPIFGMLRKLSSLGNYQSTIYVPILNAFKEEFVN
jgi:hypothetical protein